MNESTIYLPSMDVPPKMIICLEAAGHASYVWTGAACQFFFGSIVLHAEKILARRSRSRAHPNSPSLLIITTASAMLLQLAVQIGEMSRVFFLGPRIGSNRRSLGPRKVRACVL